MTLLVELSEADAERQLNRTAEPGAIAALLGRAGVRYERWTAGHALPDAATSADILSAYATDIDRLKRERGYKSADVVRLKRDPADPDWNAKARAARSRFISEHTHAEDEVRFFVEGSGVFYLRLAGSVFLVKCERGDLLSVPAGIRHWFDMGSEPEFCAIRVFGSEAGWVAAFTGDDIAKRFPDFDAVRA